MTKPDFDVYFASISGGKDSTALWLYLIELGVKIEPIFADTGWEHPETYKYLDYLESKLGTLHRVKSDLDFVKLAAHKKRFPSARARFCTTELKLNPIKVFLNQYMKENSGKTICQVTGIRAEESPARASMDDFVETDDFFKVAQWRPLHKWTWKQVFDIHKRHNIEPNPLYKRGMARVGCMPCIMANKKELAAIAHRFPEVFDKVKEAERIVNEASPHQGSSFWAVGDIPERCSSREWTNPKDGKTYKIPTPDDVKEYVMMDKYERKINAFSLFQEPPNEDLEVCSSIYGLCE